MTITIARVEARSLWPLRHAVLRQGLPAEAAVFDFDHDPATVHLAALAGPGGGDKVVGSATLHPDPFPTVAGGSAPGTPTPGEPGWRLRGMAVDPALRRSGVGRLLLGAVAGHVRDATAAGGPTLLWCNARTPAVAFYTADGWASVGGEFDVPTAGPHFVMFKRFDAGNLRTLTAGDANLG